MKLKEYIDEVMKNVTMGTAVDFDVNLDKEGEVSNNYTGSKVSFQVIKDMDKIESKISN